MNLTEQDKSWIKRNCRRNDLFIVYVLLVIITINSCDNDSKIRVMKNSEGVTVLEIRDLCNGTNVVWEVKP